MWTHIVINNEKLGPYSKCRGGGGISKNGLQDAQWGLNILTCVLHFCDDA